MLFHGLRQSRPVHIFHHQVMNSAFLARIKGSYDIGMEQLSRRFHLLPKAINLLRVLHASRRQDLKGHYPIHRPMLGFKHAAHPTGTDRPEQHIIAQDGQTWLT